MGVLRLLMDSAVEHYYFSGVYIEQAPITTSVGTGSSTGSGTPLQSLCKALCGPDGVIGHQRTPLLLSALRSGLRADPTGRRFVQFAGDDCRTLLDEVTQLHH